VATHDYVIANGTGAAVRSDLNGALAAIVSNNSNATAPATTYAYQWWADTTTGLLKIRNSANSAWVTLFQLDGEWTTLPIENGTAAAPSIYFKDSGTDTGIYSPGADQVAITTGGTSRLAVSTTAVSSTLAVDVPLGAVGTPSLTFTGDLNTGLFSPGADTLALVTGGTNRVHVTSGGLVGIGTTSPLRQLHVNSKAYFDTNGDGTTTIPSIAIGSEAVGLSYIGGGHLALLTGSNERARIDSSGRLLVGTSSSRGSYAGNLEIEGTTSAATIAVTRNSVDASPPYLFLAKSRSASVGGNAIVSNSDILGYFGFVGSDGTVPTIAASITGEVDGTPGTNDMPGRLVFSTTADGSSSPTERMRINQAGGTKITSNGGFISSTDGTHEYNQHQQLTTLYLNASHASYQNSGILFAVNRAANSVYTFFDCLSGGVSGDFEFRMKGDGNAYADGSWSGGGADYAEYFEWSDGNPDEEDRRGISVVLDGNQIRPAVDGEDPIGVISGNPSVVGDAAWNKWSGKYLRDEYGTYIQEDCEVENEDGNTVIQQRRKLNPTYDPDVEYVNREDRPEWDCVGLMGKLRIRKGQPTGSRWIKMRDISDSVEEWLVR
jgi:hypothetical protein